MNLHVESTLTDKYQVTVPDAVRKTLRLKKRDRIRFTVLPDSSVQLSRADVPCYDMHFLVLVAEEVLRHIELHPERFPVASSALRIPPTSGRRRKRRYRQAKRRLKKKKS